MTYQDDEWSVEDSRPRHAFEFTLPSVTYRLTSAPQAVTIGGKIYTPTTIEHEEIPVPNVGVSKEITITMSVTHAIPQRYLRGGLPPQRIDVIIYRYQARSADYEQVWSGRVVSLSIDRNTAQLLVASRMSDELTRRLPTITAGRDCQHILYGASCGVVKSSFTVTRTVIGFSGREVTLDSDPNASDATWAKFGELLHGGSGEVMTITKHTGNVVELQAAIPDMRNGDLVSISAGCDHTITTGCREKFNNAPNYGGQPHKPDRNPWILDGYGVFEQE